MRVRNIMFATVAVAMMTAGAANAQVNAYSLATPRTGNQTNFAGSVGLQFDVVSVIQVTRLGAFDSGQDGFSGAGVFSRIFERLSGLPVTPVVSFSSADGGILDGAYRFKDIAPVTLTPGVSYQIVSWNYGVANPNVNAGATFAPNNLPAPSTNTGGGLITFGQSRFSFAQNANPTNLDGGPNPRYGAGNFTFRLPPPPPVAGAPEPGTFALLSVGAVAMIGIARRKRS